MVTVDGCPPNRCNKRHLSIFIVPWRRVLVCIAGIVGQRWMKTPFFARVAENKSKSPQAYQIRLLKMERQLLRRRNRLLPIKENANSFSFLLLS